MPLPVEDPTEKGVLLLQVSSIIYLLHNLVYSIIDFIVDFLLTLLYSTLLY